MSDVHSPAQSERNRPRSTVEEATRKRRRIDTELIALPCGILGVVAAVWVYWLILPGVILGALAVVLGWLARRSRSHEGSSVAIALGITAILLVPSVLYIVTEAESWGRDCALDPTHDPHC
jgi:predicted PurR-regulated permease PerM